MRTFIILSSYFCIALCYPWGPPQRVQDTPEVAAAKSKHLAAHAQAGHLTSHPQAGHLATSWQSQDRSYDGSWKQENYEHLKDNGKPSWAHHSSVSHYQTKWTGPIALPPGYDKHGTPLPVQDTAEVAQEKSKHFHLYAHAAAHAASPHGSNGWA